MRRIVVGGAARRRDAVGGPTQALGLLLARFGSDGKTVWRCHAGAPDQGIVGAVALAGSWAYPRRGPSIRLFRLGPRSILFHGFLEACNRSPNLLDHDSFLRRT